MIVEYNNRELGSHEPMSERLESSNNREEFPVVSVVTGFSIGESLGDAAYRSPLSLIILLRQNRAPGEGRGVGLENELFLVVRMKEESVGKEEVLEFLVSFLLRDSHCHVAVFFRRSLRGRAIVEKP